MLLGATRWRAFRRVVLPNIATALLAGGMLYTIDLATGKATRVGAVKGINGKLLDIAVWK